MVKKLYFLLVFGAICFGTALPASAVSGAQFGVVESKDIGNYGDVLECSAGNEAPFKSGQPSVEDAGSLVRDHAEIFNPEKSKKIDERLRKLAEKYKIIPYIVTTESLGECDAEEWALSYYATNSLGLGKNGDGFLMVIAPETRDLWFIGHGQGQTAFDGYGTNFFYDVVKDPLKDDKWDESTVVFADWVEQFLEQNATGEPFSDGNPVPIPSKLLYGIGIVVAILIGLFVTWGVFQAQRNKHDTAVLQESAINYVVPQNTGIVQSNDNYVRTYTTRVKLVDSNDSSSSFSSDRSYGGSSYSSGGGKF